MSRAKSAWMTSEQLTEAFDQSATWKRIQSNDRYKSEQTYRQIAGAFRDMIIRLAAKYLFLSEREQNQILAKMDEQDMTTPLGELGIAGASFQNCHEITDSKTIGDLQKNPHEIPGMLYMSAADGGTYVILSGLGTASAFMPVLVPVAMGGAAGYILWEIFKETEEGKAFIAAWKDRSEKKAARKAEEAKAKAERKAQEEKLKAELKAEQEKNKNGGGGPKKPDDDKDKKKGLNKKQQKELNNQNRNPAKNEPVGDKGVYEDAGYHHPNSKGVKSQAPKNGQKALNNSVIVKEKGNNNYQRRVGISDGEIVVLDETSPGKYHGHVRTWKEICNDIGSKDLKKILLDNGLVDKKGNILCR